jgi:hypothetical protein
MLRACFVKEGKLGRDSVELPIVTQRDFGFRSGQSPFEKGGKQGDLNFFTPSGDQGGFAIDTTRDHQLEFFNGLQVHHTSRRLLSLASKRSLGERFSCLSTTRLDSKILSD